MDITRENEKILFPTEKGVYCFNIKENTFYGLKNKPIKTLPKIALKKFIEKEYSDIEDVILSFIRYSIYDRKNEKEISNIFFENCSCYNFIYELIKKGIIISENNFKRLDSNYYHYGKEILNNLDNIISVKQNGNTSKLRFTEILNYIISSEYYLKKNNIILPKDIENSKKEAIVEILKKQKRKNTHSVFELLMNNSTLIEYCTTLRGNGKLRYEVDDLAIKIEKVYRIAESLDREIDVQKPFVKQYFSILKDYSALIIEKNNLLWKYLNKKFYFLTQIKNEKYQIVLPKSRTDIYQESKALNCSLDWQIKDIEQLETMLIFIRKKDNLKEPYGVAKLYNEKIAYLNGKNERELREEDINIFKRQIENYLEQEQNSSLIDI